MSARSVFTKWLEGASNGSIYAKKDEIRAQFGPDDSLNAACRRFLKMCDEELQVREDFAVNAARRRMGGAA